MTFVCFLVFLSMRFFSRGWSGGDTGNKGAGEQGPFISCLSVCRVRRRGGDIDRKEGGRGQGGSKYFCCIIFLHVAYYFLSLLFVLLFLFCKFLSKKKSE